MSFDLRCRLAAFADVHRLQIADVTPQDVERYVLDIKGEDGTRFNHARLIRTLFGFAQARKYYPRDVDALEAHCKCPDDVLPFVVIGAFAGIRHHEMKRLTWDAVKWQGTH